MIKSTKVTQVAFGVKNEKSRLLAITYLHDDTNVIGANISAPLISRITLHDISTEIKPYVILQIVGRRGTNQLCLLEWYLDVLVKHTTEIPPPAALVEVHPQLP
jgi:hypothetical protein